MSASTATTAAPAAARCRMNSDDNVVFPLPPFPTNAIFTGPSQETALRSTSYSQITHCTRNDYLELRHSAYGIAAVSASAGCFRGGKDSSGSENRFHARPVDSVNDRLADAKDHRL